jgi:hypothetical protein
MSVPDIDAPNKAGGGDQQTAQPCSSCGGTGDFHDSMPYPADSIMPCPACDGSGKVDQQTARECPVCGCGDFWPGQGHHPDCPVRRKFDELADRADRAEKRVYEFEEWHKVYELRQADLRAERDALRAELDKGGWYQAGMKIAMLCLEAGTSREAHGIVEAVAEIVAERDRLLLEIGAWRCTVEAREADVQKLREAYNKAIRFIKELNATKEQHGRQYRSRCGQFLAAALNQTNTEK